MVLNGKRVLVCFFLMTFMASGMSAAGSPARGAFLAQGGRMDLSAYGFGPKTMIPLDGSWEFFWGKLVGPGDTTTPATALVSMPDGLWQNVRIDNRPLPAYGFATYRLRVAVRTGGKELALKIPEVFSACRLFVNGEELFVAGTVGTTALDSASYYQTGIVRFVPRDGDNEILIQVSNYRERRGGIDRRIYIGTVKTVSDGYSRSLALDLLVFGTLLTMGIYHLFLFWNRRKDRSPLWFGLFCLIISCRTLLYGERFLYMLFPTLPWGFFNVADHLSFYLGIPIFVEFIRLVFREYISVRAIRIYQGLGVFFSLFLFFPPAVFNTTVVFYELISGLTGAYLLSVIIYAFIHDRSDALITVIGVSVFAVSAVNEILYNTGVVQTFNTLSLGLLFFLFSQSILLAFRFSKAFSDSEHLSIRLTDTNKALRRFIPHEFFQLLNCAEVVDIKLGDKIEKDMSVMFTDIRGFTALAETMTSTQTFNFLNSYFGRVGGTIRLNGGFIDKYFGDGFMSLFANRPDDALKAAVDLQKVVVEYNRQRGSVGYAPINIGSGLNYGPLVLGTVGEKNRIDTTVISDVVNLSSRLEGLTKLYGRGTIVTKEFIEALEKPESFNWRILGLLRVQGRKEAIEAVHVYDGLPQDEWESYHRNKAAFEYAQVLYRQGKFRESEVCFTELSTLHPGDLAIGTYLSRIRLLIKTGLSSEWDGIDEIPTK
jgi:adenylate cyclase